MSIVFFIIKDNLIINVFAFKKAKAINKFEMNNHDNLIYEMKYIY